MAQSRDGQRFRDQMQPETVAFDRTDGETGTINRNKPLWLNVRRKFSRKTQLHGAIVVAALNRQDLSGRADVARDDMAANLITKLQRPFEIDLGARLQRP